jgi:hypothetical protein
VRLSFLPVAALALGACGSSASDDPTRGDTNGITVELPPPTPFKADEEAVPPETNNVSDEVPANVAGEAPPKAEEAPAKGEVPAVPKEADKPPPRAEPAPKGKAETEANVGDTRLLPGRVPLPDAAIARTIERIGFPCGTVVSSNRVDNPGGDATYKIVCSSGASYQGTNKGGRLFFREWTGKLTRD